MGQLLQPGRNSKNIRSLSERESVPTGVPSTAALGHLEPGDILTPTELAERLKVPLSWVYKQSAKDAIPVMRCGTYLRFDWAAVSAWLRSRP
jgi:excisionase family DNA binding protein